MVHRRNKTKNWTVTIYEEIEKEISVNAKTETEARKKVDNGEGEEVNSNTLTSRVTDIYSEDD